MIIGISGLARTGKSTVADFLSEFNMVSLSFADPMKRIAKDVYDFEDEHLWGASEMRSVPDKRYPRDHGPMIDEKCACCGAVMIHGDAPQCYLTPRFALQQFGTELGRICYQKTWIDYALRTAERIIKNNNLEYDCKNGLYESRCDYAQPRKVVITDVRFPNEIKALKEVGKIIRIKRTGYEKPLWNHPSETEQLAIPDSAFDFLINNDGNLDDLQNKVFSLVQNLG